MHNFKKVALSLLLVGCMSRPAPSLPAAPSMPSANLGRAKMTGGAAQLTLDIIASQTTMRPGDSQTLVAMAGDGPGTVVDVTADALWSSSAPGVATVAAGTVQAIAPGRVTIHANLMGDDATVELVVTAPAAPTLQSLTIAGPAQLPLGTGAAFTATTHSSGGAASDVTGEATWASLDPTVVTIDARGNARAVGRGAVTLTADFGGLHAAAVVTVGAPSLVSIGVSGGVTGPWRVPQRLRATGTYSDGSTADVTATASWVTNDSTIAAMDASIAGQLDGYAAGTVTATAAVGSVKGSQTITLNDAQRVGLTTDNDPRVAILVRSRRWVNAYYQYGDGTLQPIGAEAIWSSSDPRIATVGNGADVGLVTGVAVGTATLTVTAGGFTATTTVQVQTL